MANGRTLKKAQMKKSKKYNLYIKENKSRTRKTYFRKLGTRFYDFAGTLNYKNPR